MTERRKDPRSLTSNYQERRRIAALEQQQSARSKAIDSRRRLDDLALLPDLPLEEQEEEAADVPIPSTSEHHSSQQEHQSSDKNNAYALEEEEQQKYRQQQQRELRQHWASQLMNPEWLIEIPTDLATEWYVVPRPEGQRCTIFASKGRTIARLRNGIIFENFQSMLPGGSRETSGGGGDGQSNYSLLDCIYHAGTSTYYILDIMVWRGRELYDCTTEFRFFWMHSKLEEEKLTTTSSNLGNKKLCLPLPAYPATATGIHAAYSDPVTFTRDGLYFIHRRTHYSPGQTPLALTWKDAASSQYFIDTDAKGVVHPEQQIVLQYVDAPHRGVCTGDEPGIPLGMMPEQFVEKVGAKLKPGRLLKFILGAGGVQFSSSSLPPSSSFELGSNSGGAGGGHVQEDVVPVGADLKFVGVANQRRGRADTLSKILFQMMARRQPITIEMLEAVARESEMGVVAEVHGGESIGVVSGERDDDTRMND